MLGVLVTIWLLLQLPVGLLLARLIGCPQKRQAMRRAAPRRSAVVPHHARAA